MINAGVTGPNRPKPSLAASPSIDHYLQLIWYRKWIVAAIFAAVTLTTIAVVQTLPNVYTAATLILVDPQKVPETYVKSTVTGSVRDRLSTLSQQILSATRLQKIIDQLHLYQSEKKKLVREEIIAKMRKDITTSVVSDFGAGQDLQAFRISYNGTDPRVVAQVANDLATLFIEENLKAREQQSSGTTEFLENQLQETRKTLEDHEGKLRDYRLRHIGEMPEQQNADLQILGQLQNQFQLEGDALNRAEQQKSVLQATIGNQAAPVVDIDSGGGDDTGAIAPTPAKTAAGPMAVPKKSALAEDRDKLKELLTRYSSSYPDVIQLKKKVQEEEAKEAVTGVHEAAPTAATPKVPVPPPPPTLSANKSDRPASAPASRAHFNPVVQIQLESLDAEIAKHKQELQRLSKLIAGYQAKVEAIPLREQESLSLSRDYEMTKAHYAQLEAQALSAETATQLEYRQKGERFVPLDPAVPPEKPSKPNRPLLDLGGAMAGLLLGLGAVMAPEFLGVTIIGPQDIGTAGNLVLLETIPIIMTEVDQVARKRRMVVAAASAVLTTIIAGTLLILRIRNFI